MYFYIFYNAFFGKYIVIVKKYIKKYKSKDIKIKEKMLVIIKN